jgi:hypothetical protein
VCSFADDANAGPSQKHTHPAPSQRVGELELSVVIAAGEGAGSIRSCLEHLRAACAGLSHELLVVTRAGTTAAAATRDVAPEAIVVEGPADALTPALWAAGMRRARGNVIGITTESFTVAPGWAAAMCRAIASGATGAGGPITLGEGTAIADVALFYLRYAKFLTQPAVELQVHDIPGDNAAYDARALAARSASWADGFWEVDFHRRLGASEHLVHVPDAEAAFAAGVPLRSMMKQRFEHGRHSGAWRVANAIRSRAAVLLAAPAVPALLTLRTARRVLPMRSHRRRLVSALPVILVLAAAWAAGEFWGALVQSQPHDRRAIA